MFQPRPLRRNLRAALRDVSSSNAGVRASAAGDLGIAGADDPPGAAAVLEPLLRDPSPEVRAAAANSLGLLAQPGAVPTLAAALTDADSHTRQHAAIALGRIGGPAALEHLSDALASREGDVAFQALLALVELAPARGLEACLAALGHHDEWIASEAAVQLRHLLAPEAFDEDPALCTEANRARARETLRAALAGASGWKEVCVALALAHLGDARGADVLLAFVRREGRVEAAPDDADEARREAMLALARAGGERALAVLNSLAWRMLESHDRSYARAALALAGDERARGAILEDLGSMRGARRQSAAFLAGVGRVRAALPRLEQMLRRGDGDPEVLLRAVVAVGGDDARALLARLAADGALPDEAAEVLRRARERVG